MSASNASVSVAPLSDLSVCEELLTQIFTCYAEIEKLIEDLSMVAGDMKSAYAKVVIDKCWKTTKLSHSFNHELLARIGDMESKVSKEYINTTNE